MKIKFTRLSFDNEIFLELLEIGCNRRERYENFQLFMLFELLSASYLFPVKFTR